MRISDFVQASLIACHLPMTGEYVTVQPVTTGVANALGYAKAVMTQVFVKYLKVYFFIF